MEPGTGAAWHTNQQMSGWEPLSHFTQVSHGAVTVPMSPGAVTVPVSLGAVTVPVSRGAVTVPVSHGAVTSIVSWCCDCSSVSWCCDCSSVSWCCHCSSVSWCCDCSIVSWCCDCSSVSWCCDCSRVSWCCDCSSVSWGCDCSSVSWCCDCSSVSWCCDCSNVSWCSDCSSVSWCSDCSSRPPASYSMFLWPSQQLPPGANSPPPLPHRDYDNNVDGPGEDAQMRDLDNQQVWWFQASCVHRCSALGRWLILALFRVRQECADEGRWHSAGTLTSGFLCVRVLCSRKMTDAGSVQSLLQLTGPTH